MLEAQDVSNLESSKKILSGFRHLSDMNFVA